ncbi:MAG: citrate synthase [Candidatus Binatia bacterium]|nr:MAG: citrate synthase [Candidatus Binatia bacterium]
MKNTLSVTDNRTGKTYEIPIEHGAIHAEALRQIKTGPDDPGLLSYDPSLRNTARCKSKITYVDGERGILRYRGYAIEELAEKSTYLETAYLIVKGELPDVRHFEMWKYNITVHTMVHENIKKFMDGFRYDAHPTGILIGTVGALSTFYPDAKNVLDLESRRLQTRRLIGKLPTLAAFAYRRTRGLPYVYPDNELSYVGNFLSMMFRMTELRYKPDPVLERAIDKLFILCADHELSCSTNALRCVASSHVDPFSAVAASIAGLAGPRNQSTYEGVIHMLEEIGSVSRVPEFVRKVKSGELAPLGFGHPVYKTEDPRVRIMRRIAPEVFEVTGKNSITEVALELDRIAREDEYFVERHLYPNLGFWAGILYHAMGIPASMLPVMIAIPRTAGWMAHWAESIRDPEQELARPRQLYVGEDLRPYTPIEERPEPTMREDAVDWRI